MKKNKERGGRIERKDSENERIEMKRKVKRKRAKFKKKKKAKMKNKSEIETEIRGTAKIPELSLSNTLKWSLKN